MEIRTQLGVEKGGTLYETVLLLIFGKEGFCTSGETIRFCATKKTGLQGVI